MKTPEGPAAADDSASHATCIACGGRSWTPRYEVLQRCCGCGFLRADLRIDDEAIQALYAESYFRGDEYADYLAEREAHRKNFARRYEAMQRLAGDLGGIFEIGCAYGLWLEYLSSLRVRCAGVDVCTEAVAHAREKLRQDAFCGDFLRLKIDPGAFQTFVMWDTIEHLARPEQYVARIAELLPSAGSLFLTTGDVGSRNARRRGRRWRMIHPPTHLQYFSRRTMKRFLGRYGLRVEGIETAPVYRNLRGTLTALQIFGRGPVRSLARVAAALTPAPVQERLGLWTDLGDIMLVAARKA